MAIVVTQSVTCASIINVSTAAQCNYTGLGRYRVHAVSILVSIGIHSLYFISSYFDCLFVPLLSTKRRPRAVPLPRDPRLKNRKHERTVSFKQPIVTRYHHVIHKLPVYNYVISLCPFPAGCMYL